MKKKLLFTLLIVSLLITVFAVSVAAANPVFNYDENRTATLDNGNTVPLYDENGNALSYYNNGTSIVSMLTTDMFKWNGSGWLEMKDTNVVSADKVVIMNLQDPTLDATAFSNFGLNISFRNSTNLEYVFFSNMIKKFNGTYYFSNCDKLKVFEFTVDSLFESPAQYTFHDCAVLGALHFPKNVKEFPTSNSSTIGYASSCPKLSSVTFDKNIQLKKIGATAFYNAISLVSIDLPSTLTEIESNAFNNCTSLKDVMIPDSVTKVGTNAFRSTAIVNSPFTENSRCTTWGAFIFRDCDSLKNIIVPLSLATVEQDKAYGPFSECDGIEKATFGTYGSMTTLPACLFSKANVKEIVLPEGIVHIGQQAFYENKTIEKIVFPNSVETAGERVLQSCSSLKTIVFGASFKHFINTTTGDGSFTYSSNNIKNIYLPASFYAEAPETAYGVSYMFSGGGNVKFFYTGTKKQMEAAIETFKSSTTNGTNNNGNLIGATLVSKADYDANPSNYDSGDYIIYGCDICETFYNGIHDIKQEGDNKCSGVCGNCGKIELIQNPTHTYEWIFNGGKDISYTVAFNAESKCKFCATANPDEEIVEIGAILYSNGISIDETDYTGIYEQIKVDKTALEAYSTLSGKQFDYGIFALAAGEAETSEPIAKGQDGKATADDKTVYASFTGTEYTYLRIKITGLSNGSSIFCGAYLIIGDNVIYVSNKQEGKEVNKYTMVTEQA